MRQGSLFTQDFLEEGIVETDEWRALDAEVVEGFAPAKQRVLVGFPVSGTVIRKISREVCDGN